MAFRSLALLPLLILVACAGEEFTPGGASGAAGEGAAGVAGSAGTSGGGSAGAAGEPSMGGSAGEGGSAGQGGSAGDAGAAGEGGSAGAGGAGAAGSAGSAGDGGQGGGAPCKAELECVTDDPCVAVRCEQGHCVIDGPQPFISLPDDVQGDCKKPVCDEQAKRVYDNDPEDVDKDGGCSGTQHKACAADSECVPLGPCAVAVCKSNLCQQSLLPPGTPIPDDIKGDCREPFCDEDGKVIYKEAPGDTAGGVCSLLAATTCSKPSDCLAPAACVDVQCAQNACVYTAKPEGTVAHDDTAGDCARPVCDGKGGTQNVFDENDVKEDDNECTKAHCGGDGVVLEATPGVKCKGGVCAADGSCVECVFGSDCPDGKKHCILGACVADDTLSKAGCADGDREGMKDMDTFKNVAACDGAWSVAGVAALACERQAGNHNERADGVGCGAQDLCAAGWHVCTSGTEVLGTLPQGSAACPVGDFAEAAFYATGQSGPGDNLCVAGDGKTNDVFGCGKPPGQPTLSTCPPFNAVLSTQAVDTQNPTFLSGNWGFASTDASATELLDVVKMSPDAGGVLCCRDGITGSDGVPLRSPHEPTRPSRRRRPPPARRGALRPGARGLRGSRGRRRPARAAGLRALGAL